MFRQVAELDTAMRVVMSSLPVDEAVIGDAMLALGAVAAGPVRLGAEVLKNTLVGEYIDDASRAAKDYVSTAMAGAAHNADRESMAHVAGAEADLYEALYGFTESLEGPVSSYSEENRALYDSLNQSIALSEEFGDTLHGAQIVTDYVFAVMVGAGGGVAKSSRGDDKTGSDQRDHEVRETDSESEARVTKGAGKKIPNCELCGPPNKRGNAPIGNDGHPVELHHLDQNPNGPLDEMTRSDHRLGDNFKKNHSNTGQEPSKIDRSAWRKEQKDYWKNEWDSGRFDDL